MAIISYEVGDLCYDVEIEHYTPAHAARGWDPGDGGEITLGRVVEVDFGGSVTDFVTYETFVREYAADRGLSLRAAEQRIEDRAYEYEAERRAEMFDDRGEWS